MRITGVRRILGCLSVAVGALGTSSSVIEVRANKSMMPASAVKGTEQYWAETGISMNHLVNVLSKENCFEDHRNFLGCANAVTILSNRIHKQVSPEGKIENSTGEVGFDRETDRLKAWESIDETKSSVSFVDIATKLMKEVGPEQKAATIGAAINGYLSIAEDPHSYLLPKKYYQEVVAKSDHRSKSLGFLVAKKGDGILVKKVIPNSPIAEVGIEAGDQIIQVADEKIDATKMGVLPEVIRNKQLTSTKIAFTILRSGKELSFEVPFKDFVYSTVTSSWLSKDKKVALLGINKFSKGLCEKVKSALADLHKENAEGIIVDLRDNSGGQMSEAACVASLFIGSEKPVFSIKYFNGNGSDETYYGKENQMYSRPLAVLINDGSASAAEILAGTLQDYHRAVVVGSQSFGKGSFQEPEELEGFEGMYHFKTMGFYYLPSGRSPQIVGIQPDVTVASEFDGDHEANLYLFPLQAPITEKKIAMNEMGNCLSQNVSNPVKNSDQEIERAAQVLQCQR